MAKIRSQHLGTKRSAIEFHHGILIARLLPDSVILPSLFLLFPCKRWRRYGLRWKGESARRISFFSLSLSSQVPFISFINCISSLNPFSLSPNVIVDTICNRRQFMVLRMQHHTINSLINTFCICKLRRPASWEANESANLRAFQGSTRPETHEVM